MSADGRAAVLRLYMQNCYLVPGFFTLNPIFWGCKNQADRAARIGRTAGDNDLACLCEVWGSGSTELAQAVGEGHEHRGSSITQLGPLNSTCATIGNFFSKTGGLHECWDRKSLRLRTQATRQFSRSVPLARQGASALSFDAGRWGDGWRLVVFNCHFTILGGAEARANNRDELVSFMREFIETEIGEAAARHDKTVVLLAGDLNLGPMQEDQTNNGIERIASEYTSILTLGGAGRMRDWYA